MTATAAPRRPAGPPPGAAHVPPPVVRLFVRPLPLRLPVAEVVRRLAHRERVTAWSGAWSRGAVVTCDPQVVVHLATEAVPALLADQPIVRSARPGAVGGGWFGYLAGPGSTALSSWGWYRDVLRNDGATWWYEALLDGDFDRTAAEHRVAGLLRSLGTPATAPPARIVDVRSPPADPHLAAVERCQQQIRAGEIYQANIATRLDMQLVGPVHDAWARLVEQLDPARAALVADPVLGLVGAGPELFLRRAGRAVHTEPIKGTRPRTGGPADADERQRLRASAKDAAENVMIVDLMRNDLGRVCEPGTVRVPRLLEVRPAPGVWHLVSTVCGELAADRDDADLLAATFPPGSVTGAPKLRAMEVIGELEPRSRGLFTGAAGYAGPLAGLELAVTIRSLEVAPDGGAQLGVGGGITVDSAPDQEWAECLAKAAPLLRVLGAPSETAPQRPPPAGLVETLLVVDGRPRRPAAHLGRLRRSYWECYGVPLTADVAAAVDAAILPGVGHQCVRIEATPGRPDTVRAGARPCAAPVPVAEQQGVELVGREVAVGSAYASTDRAHLDAAEAGLPPGSCALLVGPGGRLWGTTRSNVFVVVDGEVRTPPLDGDVVPGTGRQHVLDRLAAQGIAHRIVALSVADLARADGAFLTDALHGPRWVRKLDGQVLRDAPHPVLAMIAP